MQFNRNNHHDLLHRLQMALENECASLLRSIRNDNKIVKFHVALKALFHKAVEPHKITDPPAVFSNGEVFTLTPGHNIDLQLEVMYHNLVTLIDKYEKVLIYDIFLTQIVELGLIF